MDMDSIKKSINNKHEEKPTQKKLVFKFKKREEKPVKVEEPKEEEQAVVEKPEVKDEPINVETDQKEETVVAEIAETEVKPIEEKQEEVEEEHKVVHRRRRKKTADVTTPNESAGLENYTESITSICNPIYDEEWEKEKKFLKDKILDINISHDTDPAVLNILIESIDALSTTVILAYHEAKSVYDNIVDKDYGLLNKVKVLNTAGTNAEERKTSGFNACVNYTDERTGQSYDLFLLATESRTRMGFLEGMYKTLLCKKDLLVTLNGSLKLSK